jgi:aldose 1-epimerase
MPTNLVEITSGDASATVDAFGSGLVSLRLAGREVIPAPGVDRHPYHGVALAPWPNRIAGGRYSFNGQDFELPINEAFGNALHGFSFVIDAAVDRTAENRVLLSHEISPSAGYPFSLVVTLEFELTETELTVTTTAKNIGTESCPVGLGTHPFFVFDDTSTLEVFAKTAAIHGPDMMPIDSVSAGEIGFGAGLRKVISDVPLDVQLTEIEPTCAILRTRAGSFEVFQEGAEYLMVYTTEAFNWGDGRTKAVAIEPQTCAADAFNSGAGLQILEPGKSFSYRWGVRATKE